MSNRDQHHPEIVDLGRKPFREVHEMMLSIAQSIRSEGSAGKILLVEHDPVFTAGRATPPAELTPDIVPIERGGKVTYHGPGQLIIYPIVPLPQRDARAWLQRLERFGVALCRELGVEAQMSTDGTGVFVNGLKVGSIGVALRHWINLHGIALNIAMDLAPFGRIKPCGLDPSVLSDLSTVCGRPLTMTRAKSAAESQVGLLTAP